MDAGIRLAIEDVKSGDRKRRGAGFAVLLGRTKVRVDWAYEVWDEMVAIAVDAGNPGRAMAGHVLCQLAQSDPEGRMAGVFGHLLDLTRGEWFPAGRPCPQALWRAGLAGEAARPMVVEGLPGGLSSVRGRSMRCLFAMT